MFPHRPREQRHRRKTYHLHQKREEHRLDNDIFPRLQRTEIFIEFGDDREPLAEPQPAFRAMRGW